MTIRGCFGLDTARVKGARRAEERKKGENEDDETLIFTVSWFVTLVTISNNLLATLRLGNAREQV